MPLQALAAIAAGLRDERGTNNGAGNQSQVDLGEEPIYPGPAA